MSDAQADRLLQELGRSDLFAEDFPQRRSFTHAEWAQLSDEQRMQKYEPGKMAIARLKNSTPLRKLIEQLGKARHSAAVPLLAQLWASCGDDPIRGTAGYALYAIGTPEARRALWDMIEDADLLSVRLAIAGAFAEDPGASFSRFLPWFEPARVDQPGGSTIPKAVLSIFAPYGFKRAPGGGVVQLWSNPTGPALLREDARWLDLCVSLRRHPSLGGLARRTLRYASRALVDPALAKARAQEVRHVVQVTTEGPGDLLSRYLRGEHVEVWQELRSHEAVGGALLEEARSVARETMSRVMRNADRLAGRLAAVGWEPRVGELRTKPKGEDQSLIGQMEAMTETPAPLSLRAFWEIVGGVNFMWNYEKDRGAPSLGVELPLARMDPLCVDPPDVLTYQLKHWQHERRDVDPELVDPFFLELAPDYLHKAHISGGACYGIELLCPGVDPIFKNEAHKLPFVDYLRLCFRWAGFPLLEQHADRPDVREFLRVMSQDLEAF